MNNKPQIGFLALTLLILGSIDSVRNLPSTALFGTSLIFFYCLAAIFFLFPIALVSAELAAHTDKSGIYLWARQAFGKPTALFAIWLQWINTVVWCPTILSFIAGSLSYLLNPEWAHHPLYLIVVILSTIWGMTWINSMGLRISSQFAGICTLLGLIVPMTAIICFGIYWLLSGKPTAISLDWAHVIPPFNKMDHWISLTAIITSFLGTELSSVHIKEIKNAKRNFPSALGTAVVGILFTMIAGSLSIAMVIPKEQIGLVDGVMQTFQFFLQQYHLGFLTPIFAVLLILGSLGGMINWIIAPAKGLGQAAKDGFLPTWLGHLNSHNAPQNILITQALIVSLLSLLFILLPSVNSAYWLLTDLSTEIYVLMYVVMFIVAIKLKSAQKSASHIAHKLSKTTHKEDTNKNPYFSIPGGKVGFYLTCALGLLGSGVTLIIGFFPPAHIPFGTTRYEFIFFIGMLIMIAPVGIFYLTSSKSK